MTQYAQNVIIAVILFVCFLMEDNMNDKNRELFFNESDDEIVLVTIEPEDSEPFDVEIIASVEIEDKEYVAVLPTEPLEDIEEGELILLIYSEDADGNPEFEGITDEEELQMVAGAFEKFFENQAQEI